MKLSLERYHGLGNDYLVLDPNKFNLPLNEKIIRLICDRNFGFGSDGILLGPIFEDGGFRVRIYNPDGSEAEKSGNGVASSPAT
jgi:diaminopimelate epimerase